MSDSEDVHLPTVIETTTPALAALTEALGVSRNTLASDAEIASVWGNLPGVLKKVPPELRTEGLARMCVAVNIATSITPLLSCSINGQE